MKVEKLFQCRFLSYLEGLKKILSIEKDKLTIFLDEVQFIYFDDI